MGRSATEKEKEKNIYIVTCNVNTSRDENMWQRVLSSTYFCQVPMLSLWSLTSNPT